MGNMKVLCVDNIGVTLSLSIGKWYKVYDHELSVLTGDVVSYTIISDRGNKQKACVSFFMTLDRLREKKLEELGI